jgi:hypothetical protein
MKNENTNLVVAVGYHIPELDKELASRTAALRQKVEIASQSDTSRGLPRDGAELDLCTQFIFDESQELIDYSHKVIGGAFNIKHQVDAHSDVCEAEKVELINQRADAQSKKNDLVVELNKLPVPQKPRSKVIATIVIACISFTEALVTGIPAFLSTNIPVWAAYATGICYGIAMMIFSHLTAIIIAKANTRTMRVLLIILMTTIAAIVFYMMSEQRILYKVGIAHEKGITTGFTTSREFITCVSLFLYMIACLVSWIYMPTREQLAAYESYKEKHDAINDLEEEIKRLSQLIIDKENEKIRYKAEYVKVYMYGFDTEQQITGTAISLRSQYCKSNLRRRHPLPDSIAFFSLPSPYEFRRYFLIPQ